MAVKIDKKHKMIVVIVPYGTDDEVRNNFIDATKRNAEPGWVVREMPVP